MNYLVMAVYDEKSLRKKIRFRQTFQYELTIPGAERNSRPRADAKTLAKND